MEWPLVKTHTVVKLAFNYLALKAALINIFQLTIDQMSMCYAVMNLPSAL